MMLTLTVLCFLSFATVVPRVICPNQTNEAGQSNISLTAYLDPPVDLSAYTVVWTRDDLNKNVVHAYRHGLDIIREQSDQYKRRTTLRREDLSRGNLTLWISSAQPSDSGRYKVYIPKLRVGCITDVYVDAANMKAIISSVVVAAAAVGGLIILVKSGKIKTCKKTQEGEVTPPNSEMEHLNTINREE